MGDASLPVGGSAAEVVEVAVEPVVDLSVDRVIVVTYLLRGLALLDGLDLGGSAILISTTNVQGVITHQPGVAGKHISTEYTSDNVAEVRNIIHIG